MNVRVSSLIHAGKLAMGWADQVVSLLDPQIPQREIPTPQTFGIDASNWICRFFEDREDEHGPTFEAVRDILASVRSDSRVLVHCHAGMGRSPAIAIGIMICRGMKPEAAFDAIFTQNLIDNEGDLMEPNELIIQHVDRFCGLDGRLLPMLRSVK